MLNKLDGSKRLTKMEGDAPRIVEHSLILRDVQLNNCMAVTSSSEAAELYRVKEGQTFKSLKVYIMGLCSSYRIYCYFPPLSLSLSPPLSLSPSPLSFPLSPLLGGGWMCGLGGGCTGPARRETGIAGAISSRHLLYSNRGCSQIQRQIPPHN